MTCACMAPDKNDRLDIEWGSDTCNVCEDETWLTMVLYEPIHVLSGQTEEEKPVTHRHPVQQDEESIAVCGQCLGESVARVAELYEVDRAEVAFDKVWKYLVYLSHPGYATRAFPDEVESFEGLSQG